jgi:hypothetical protein
LNGPPIYLKLPAVAGVSKLVATLTVGLAAAPVTDGALRSEVDRLVAAIAVARHLPFHGTLAARAVPRVSAEREGAVAIGVGVSTAGGEVEGEILKRLGLLPADVDYGTLVARTYGSSASQGATYDIATARLSVPDFIPLPDQRVALTHEIAHAVADQHFGLRDFLKLAPEITAGAGRRIEGDAERARLALVEGDATLSALELLDPHEAFLGAHELPVLAGRLREATTAPAAPLWFGELASFTHVDGLLFEGRVRARGPWSAVDALWGDPPASTEQVLHPEKYEACEAPIPVDEGTLPELPGFGRPTASDVLGELVARTWLASVLPPEIAARAAAGWGGDRAGIYTAKPSASPDGGTAAERPLAWLTVWDDSGEAEDFARAARQVLAAQTRSTPATSAQATIAPSGGTGGGSATGSRLGPRAPSRAALPPDERAVFTSPEGIYALDRRGETVALLFGAPAPGVPTLDEMLDRWRTRQAASRRAATRPRHAAPPGCPRRDRAAGRG